MQRTLKDWMLSAAMGLLLVVGGAGAAFGQVGSCIAGMTKIYDGACKSAEQSSGSCTTRIEQTPEARWCCCDDDYEPEDDSDDNTDDPGGNTDDPKGPGICSTSVATPRTDHPATTILIARAFRDKALLANNSGSEYVTMYYKYNGEVTKLLMMSPRLMKKTVQALDTNRKVMADLATGKKVTIGKRRMRQASALLREFRSAAGADSDLGRALSTLDQDLRNEKFLAQFGVSIGK